MWILYALLCIGVGYALFIAAREFVSGVKLGVQQQNARAGADSASNRREPPPGSDRSSGVAQGPREPRPWHEVLDVAPAAGPDEIRAAYRRKIALYHPDKVASLGEDLRRLAEIRSQEINEAYAFARSRRRA